MKCARCGTKLVYGNHIRSRFTGYDYCRDYGDCVRRVLDANGDSKLVKGEMGSPPLTDSKQGSLT